MVERLAAQRAAEAARVFEEQDRVFARTEANALMHGRQKARAPQPVVERLVPFAGQHGDESRQVFIFAAQAVTHPRADARPAGDLKTSLKEGNGRIVIDGRCVERLHEA